MNKTENPNVHRAYILVETNKFIVCPAMIHVQKKNKAKKGERGFLSGCVNKNEDENTCDSGSKWARRGSKKKRPWNMGHNPQPLLKTFSTYSLSSKVWESSSTVLKV